MVKRTDYENGYNILVKWGDEGSISYTPDGRYEKDDAYPSLYHAGSIKREGSKIIIDPVKPVRGKWVNVYMDSEDKPFFGKTFNSEAEIAAEGHPPLTFLVSTIQLKRSTK